MGLNYFFIHFRWKGENVATTEVSDVIVMLDFIQEANVYGVSVPGKSLRSILVLPVSLLTLITLSFPVLNMNHV